MKRVLGLIFVTLLSLNTFAGNDKGKVVFSDKRIDATTGMNIQPVTLQSHDSIYCRVYLTQPLGKYKKDGYKGSDWSIELTLDGKKLETQYEINGGGKGYTQEEAATLTTFDFVLGFDPSFGATTYKDEFVEAINKLQPGTHTVQVSVKGKNGNGGYFKDIAVGEFILNKSDKKLKGFTFNDIKAGMSDPSVEAKCIEVMLDWFKKNEQGTVLKTQKCKILNSDWMIVTHPNSGAILGRALNVAFFVKTAKGDCEIKVFCFEQSYAGSTYQNTVHMRDFLNCCDTYNHLGYRDKKPCD